MIRFLLLWLTLSLATLAVASMALVFFGSPDPEERQETTT